jgi:hypothetical protein
MYTNLKEKLMNKWLLMLALLSITDHAPGQEIFLNGSAFSPKSKNASTNGSAGKVAGMISYGAVIYEFSLPPGTKRFKASVQFVKQRGKELKIYIYNYGPFADNDTADNKKLASNWWFWQTAENDGVWISTNPEWSYTGGPGGKYDFLGPQSRLKILLYADGGVPFLGDGCYLIQRVAIISDDAAEGANASATPVIIASENARVEGRFLLVSGLGVVNPKTTGDDEKTKRLMAIRAAIVVAQRNLAVALGAIPQIGGETQITGYRVHETKDLGNGQYRVTIEVPLDIIQTR